MSSPLLAFAVLSVCSALLAQDPAAPAPKPPAPPDRVEQRSQAMREQIGTGRQVDSHVRVAVRLKNGNRLIGVVKDGRLVERVDGLRFVDAQARDAGAGIRLWYSGNGRNYVFVPFVDFAEYEVLQRLTAKQLADIEREMQQEEKKAPPVQGKTDAEVAATPPAEPAGDAADKPPSPAGEGVPAAVPAAGDGAAAAQQRKWYELLAAYPPKEGWSRHKRDEIARRFVVIGAKPSEHEQKFVDQFAEWEKACAHFGIDAKVVEGGEAATGKAGKHKARGAKASEGEPATDPGAQPAGESTATGGKQKRRKG